MKRSNTSFQKIAIPPAGNIQKGRFYKFRRVAFLLISLLVVILYANTLTLDYALDDKTVITQNRDYNKHR